MSSAGSVERDRRHHPGHSELSSEVNGRFPGGRPVRRRTVCRARSARRSAGAPPRADRRARPAGPDGTRSSPSAGFSEPRRPCSRKGAAAAVSRDRGSRPSDDVPHKPSLTNTSVRGRNPYAHGREVGRLLLPRHARIAHGCAYVHLRRQHAQRGVEANWSMPAAVEPSAIAAAPIRARFRDPLRLDSALRGDQEPVHPRARRCRRAAGARSARRPPGGRRGACSARRPPPGRVARWCASTTRRTRPCPP